MLALVVATGTMGGITVTQAQTQETAYKPDQSIKPSEQEQLSRKLVGYFPEWAYKSEAQGNFMVTDLQWDYLTHIQYSFAMIDPATHKIALGDKVAAIEEEFVGRTMTYKGKEVKLDPTLPYKGHFNLLQVMKKQYPDTKLLISVGGWAGSTGFYTMLDTDAGIETFADSCVDFVRTYGFDGVDIDFEYPSSTATSGNPDDSHLSEPRRKELNARYNKMMEVLREKLDEASREDGEYYYLTAAVTASPWVLGGMSSHDFVEYLDFVSVMSYDYHGGWNEYVENLANIYPDPADRETANQIMPNLCMDWAYRYYRGALPAEKILMGIPYYTRGWENVSGGTNGLHGGSRTPATGEYNIWGDDLNGDEILEPAGANPIWHVKNLLEEDPHFNRYWDDVGKVPYVWQDEKRVFLSYEDEQSINERVKYIDDKNLGGALIWVMNGDYGINDNYVEGSTNVNEGKYTFGDTLTKELSNGFDRIGLCERSDDGLSDLPPIAVDVDFDGIYDHPNYTYKIHVTNNTGAEIPGGWTVSFDLPKSAVFKSSWAGNATQEDVGEFTRVTLTAGAWNKIPVGAKVSIEGMIGLSFSEVRNITFNGCIPSSEVLPMPKPLPATVQSDVPEVLIGKPYKVTATIPANSQAETYEVKENNKIIKQGAVDAKGMVVELPMIKDKAGEYSYDVILRNAVGETKSNSVKVMVTEQLSKPLAGSVVATPVIEGNYDITMTIPAKSQATSYTLYENNIAIKTDSVDPNSAATFTESFKEKEVGTYSYTLELANAVGKTTSNEAQVVVEEVKPQPEKPKAATLSATEVVEGNYEVTGSIPANSFATEYVLYENGVKIQGGQVDPSAASKVKESFEAKAVGTYNYTLELTNTVGKTTSNTVSVVVKEDKPEPPKPSVEKPGTPQLKQTTWNGEKDYSIGFDMWWGSNGNEWRLYENGKLIHTAKLTPNGSAAQSGTVAISQEENGSYEYYAELENEGGITKSNVITIKVTQVAGDDGNGDGGGNGGATDKPATPSLQHDNWDTNSEYTMSFNMWWGVNGTEWTLYENGTAIHTQGLSANGSNAQSGTYKVTGKEAGKYTYYVELANEAGTSKSEEVVVTVN